VKLHIGRLVLASLSLPVLLYAQAQDRPGQTRPIEPLLQQIETYVQSAMDKTGVPGVAVAIVYKDRVVYLKGFGLR